MLTNVFFFFSPYSLRCCPDSRLSQQVSAQLPAQNLSYLLWFDSDFLSDVILSKIRVGIAEFSSIQGFCLGTTACLQFISLKSAPFFDSQPPLAALSLTLRHDYGASHLSGVD